MRVKSRADGAHVSVNIKVQQQFLLNLKDDDEGTVKLFPGIIYRFEWFVITGHDAHILIEATVSPDNQGFPPLSIIKTYPPGVQDGNVFLFTLN